jgi:hypothetical protein
MKAQQGDGDGNGQVEPLADELSDFGEPTERSLVDVDVIAPDPAAKPAALVTPLPPPSPLLPRAADKIARERRPTVVSSIPAQLAKSMMSDVRPSAPAPAPMQAEVTRPVSDAQPQPGAAPGAHPDAHPDFDSAAVYSVVDVIDEPSLPPRAHIQALINRARSLMEGGNLGGAVIAADQTLVEAAKARQDEVADLVKAGRPLFDRIFAAYVGLLGQVPVRLRSDEELTGQELGERTKYLLSHIDGKQTLEELSTHTAIPPVEAMKIAASLLAANIIRV